MPYVPVAEKLVDSSGSVYGSDARSGFEQVMHFRFELAKQ